MDTFDIQRPLVSQVAAIMTQAITKLANDRDLPTDWEVIVTLQVQAPTMFHIQRTGCNRPRIAVAFDYAAGFLHPKTPSEQTIALRDFRRRALNAINFANKLGHASPLVTGDLAYQMGEDRKALRRVPILNSLDYALPDRYFRVESTVTVTCALTGRTLTSSVPFQGSYDATVQSLRNELSRQLLIDSETEALVDLIESAREAHEPSEIQRVEIRSVAGGEGTDPGEQTLISYKQSEHFPPDAGRRDTQGNTQGTQGLLIEGRH